MKAQILGKYCIRTVLLPSILDFGVLEKWEKLIPWYTCYGAIVKCTTTVVIGCVSGKQLTYFHIKLNFSIPFIIFLKVFGSRYMAFCEEKPFFAFISVSVS